MGEGGAGGSLRGICEGQMEGVSGGQVLERAPGGSVLKGVTNR